MTMPGIGIPHYAEAFTAIVSFDSITGFTASNLLGGEAGIYLFHRRGPTEDSGQYAHVQLLLEDSSGVIGGKAQRQGQNATIRTEALSADLGAVTSGQLKIELTANNQVKYWFAVNGGAFAQSGGPGYATLTPSGTSDVRSCPGLTPNYLNVCVGQYQGSTAPISIRVTSITFTGVS